MDDWEYPYFWEYPFRTNFLDSCHTHPYVAYVQSYDKCLAGKCEVLPCITRSRRPLKSLNVLSTLREKYGAGKEK